MSSSSSSQPLSLKDCFKNTQEAFNNAQNTFEPMLDAAEKQEHAFFDLKIQIDTLRQVVRAQEKEDQYIQENADEQSGQTQAELRESLRRSTISNKKYQSGQRVRAPPLPDLESDGNSKQGGESSTKKKSSSSTVLSSSDSDVDEQSGQTWTELKESLRLHEISKKKYKSDQRVRAPPLPDLESDGYSKQGGDSDVEPEGTSNCRNRVGSATKKVLSSESSDDSSEPENKPKHSPSKKCPQCGAKIPCACTKCPQCGKSALRQDKRSKAERERRERKRRKINGHVATKLKFTEEVSA